MLEDVKNKYNITTSHKIIYHVQGSSKKKQSRSSPSKKCFTVLQLKQADMWKYLYTYILQW
jgi:23S rRNA maturation-related 3'-5' exoribonuclease YhaM